MAIRLSCSLLLLLGLACGDSGGGGDDTYFTGDGGPRQACADKDGDGYDAYCGALLDCDDEDPDVKDECFICETERPGCSCTPGTKPIHCDPDDIRTVQDGRTGIIRCDEGNQYCRDGVWSECEILLQYATFIPD